VHSGTFRELQHKTQVQSVLHVPEDIGISFRTRLNHVIEVAQLARGIAQEIAGDEALAEAIALAHDLGHPPFGHAGERALRDALRDYGREGWNANVHSLAVVDEVETAFVAFRGLNLTWATREGIARHSTPFDEPVSAGEFVETPFGGLECQIVDGADVLAYLAHDLDDAVGGSFIDLDEIASVSPLLAERIADAERAWHADGPSVWPEHERGALLRRRLVAQLISMMIADLARTTRGRISDLNIESATDVREAPARVVVHSPEFADVTHKLLNLLRTQYYRSVVVRAADEQAKETIRMLFEALVSRRDLVPERFRREDDVIDAATYLASLNDRSATSLAERLGVPQSSPSG
jgi:dGTPase